MITQYMISASNKEASERRMVRTAKRLNATLPSPLHRRRGYSSRYPPQKTHPPAG